MHAHTIPVMTSTVLSLQKSVANRPAQDILRIFPRKQMFIVIKNSLINDRFSSIFNRHSLVFQSEASLGYEEV